MPVGTSITALAAIVSPPSLVGIRTEVINYGQAASCRLTESSRSNGRIAYAFRGQWNIEELFRRAKKGGIAPWGPSHQWADSSLRLHTFATVIGLMLVSLVRLELGTRKSASSMMKTLAEVKATLVRVRTKERG